MTIEEVIDLLAVAAAFDQRTIGEADAVAWHAAIGDLDFADARAAVIGHYRESRDRVMPADVFKRVKAARRDRLAREVIPAPGHELTDQPGRYKAALDGILARIASGLSARKAIAAPVREGAPPEAFTRARAAIGPPSRQDIARAQAEESRAGRHAGDGGEAA